jgi:alanine racemase
VSPRFRPTRVEVDLGAIRHNVTMLKPPGAELMAVVKANAYGHGDVAVAWAALEAGATWLGVALVEEGLRLREAGIEVPILVLSECPAGSEGAALGARLTPTVYTDAGLGRLGAAAASGGRISVHVKVDTGMHRVGVWPPEEAAAFLERVRANGMEVEGLWTHLATSEDDEVTTKIQLDRFASILEDARATGIAPRYVHAANSGAVIRHPEATFDIVRPGIALYGIPPAPGVGDELGLHPALTWRSEVAFSRKLPAGARISYGHRYELQRDAWVATVPVGYADGYPRAASSRGEVLIGGRRCRVAGTVTMDQTMVDCGDLEVAAGDEAILIGRQGSEAITASDLGAATGTIGYEIVARIGDRVPRGYVG